MSLFGALSASVAGLDVQSNALGIISDNIANVSTVGYKAASATFDALVTNSSGTGEYTPGGVVGSSQALVSTQGLLQTTSSPTDIAISGGGLFVTNTKGDGSGQVLYTRSGSFTQNAQGNFVNTAGLFLQAWPLDRNGNLPGAPGNLDTTSAANLTSLQTVNVQNLAGTASATSKVSLGANLNSSQTALAGAKGAATLDKLDTANYPLTGSDIIIPTGVDSIAKGDTINVSTGNNPTGFNYVYGGFTYGRDVTSAAPSADGENGVNLLPTSTTLNSPVNPPAGAFASSATTNVVNTGAGAFQTNAPGSGEIDVTVGSTAGMYDGQTVTIAGPATTLDGIPSADMTGNYQIHVIDATHFSFTAGGAATASAGGVTGGAGGGAETVTTGSGTVSITVASTANMRSGQYINLVGPAAGLDANISQADLTGTFQITVVDATHVSITAANNHVSVASGETAGAGGGAETITPDPFVTTNGSKTVTVNAPANGLANGDVVTFSGINGPGGLVNGIPVAQLNTSFVISNVTADSYQITVATTAATSSGGAPTTGTISENARPYAGNVLDATNASQALLGVTGITGIAPNALSFTINTAASGTVKFTYVSTAPNTSLGQFTTLDDLANAINGTTGLSARIVNNRLWVGATDATQAVTFANGQATATPGPPILSGVDWVSELGVQNIAAGANRFDSLNSLAALVNVSSGLAGAVVNPSATASLNISVVNPSDTITFKDGTGNTGSLLAQLGLATSENSGTVALRTAGPSGPAYNPQVSATNMASGAIPPQFSYPVTVFDGLGTAHSLNVAFSKLQNNTWAVEIFAQPATDITPASSTLVDGQLATGTISFNGDGSLQNVSSSLTSAFPINWTDGSIQSNVTFDWGSAGQPAGTVGATQIGGTNGLSQFDSGFNVSFANQNGAPVGQLTGISIGTNGDITASYSNGETQNLYRIPLASFTDANELTAQSGDAYAQSNGSGIVNLKQPGASGVGTISSGALESSNADLAAELTHMIVAQRAYQANSKVIQTANSLLSDLDQIIQ